MQIFIHQLLKSSCFPRGTARNIGATLRLLSQVPVYLITYWNWCILALNSWLGYSCTFKCL